MRELSISELNLVSGGKNDSQKGNKLDYTDGLNIGAGIGGGMASLFKGASGDMIARGAGRGGLVGLAGVAGWNFGTYLYEDTFVGEKINEWTDKLIEQQFNDKSGNDYGDKSGNSYGDTAKKK